MSPLTGCNKGCSVPGHCFRPFFPSSLHGPQCLHPALGTWLCHPHPSWSRNEEEQPENTEADRRPVKDQAWRAQGPVWTSCRGGPVEARSAPRRREDKPPSIEDKLPADYFILHSSPEPYVGEGPHIWSGAHRGEGHLPCLSRACLPGTTALSPVHRWA